MHNFRNLMANRKCETIPLCYKFYAFNSFCFLPYHNNLYCSGTAFSVKNDDDVLKYSIKHTFVIFVCITSRIILIQINKAYIYLMIVSLAYGLSASTDLSYIYFSYYLWYKFST